MLRDCVASLLADTSRRAARGGRRRQRLDRRLRRALRAALPRRHRDRPRREPRLRPRRQPRHRGDPRADRRGDEPRRRGRAGDRGRGARPLRGRRPSSPRSGPQLRNPDGTRYPSARAAPSLGDAVGHAVLGTVCAATTASPARTASSTPTRTCPRDVEWISGAAIWLRRDALDRVGGWDERFFLFFEDVDLCRRLRAARLARRATSPAATCARRAGAAAPGARCGRSRAPPAAYQYAAKWWHGPAPSAAARGRGCSSPSAGAVVAGRRRGCGRAQERPTASE